MAVIARITWPSRMRDFLGRGSRSASEDGLVVVAGCPTFPDTLPPFPPPLRTPHIVITWPILSVLGTGPYYYSSGLNG